MQKIFLKNKNSDNNDIGIGCQWLGSLVQQASKGHYQTKRVFAARVNVSL